MALIFPSIISGDILHLAQQMAALESYASGFHLDVMDFHFVPNLTWGPTFINAIRKEETDKETLLSLSYPNHLWLEKEIKSAANVARSDVSGFLQLAAEMLIRPEVEEYPLQDANRALIELKVAKIRGAKVLRM